MNDAVSSMNTHVFSKQAVILAGGRGERLRPLTDSVPKPLVKVGNRPFLDYLLFLLKSQGFEHVVLLLGYLAEHVQRHVGTGEQFGLRVDYSVSPVENETGRRLLLANPILESNFLLMYCDNYWPLQIEPMWEQFVRSDVSSMLTIYTNRDQYTKDNVEIDKTGLIVNYDKSRKSSGLSGVDIGYSLLKKDVLKDMPDENGSFEAMVYPVLAKRQQLAAYTTDHRYYSIGSMDRLPMTEQFVRPQKTVILDRDGVLNHKPPRATYVKEWKEFHWISGSIEALVLLREAGFRFIVATNQAGIARGILTQGELRCIHEHMQFELKQAGIEIDKIYVCPHGWDEGCFCRKPNPGMLFEAQRDFCLDLTKTFFVGDDERDLAAGQAAGCRSFLVSEEFPLLSWVKRILLTSECA